jgi:YHS domain-containing protein
MELTTFETDGSTVRAGYACPCGCNPSVTYQRGGAAATNSCCCGNEFVVGPGAERSLVPRDGFELASEQRMAGWSEPVTAAWLVGPSVHPQPADGQGDTGHDHHHHDDDPESAADDPVCGMNVAPASALDKGLHRQYEGVDYYFCGKGCYLDFGDDPGRYLDPSYVPSM